MHAHILILNSYILVSLIAIEGGFSSKEHNSGNEQIVKLSKNSIMLNYKYS